MKKRKLNPKTIRKGDIVEIQNPEVFIRCGYPMCKEDAKKAVTKQFGNLVVDLIKTVRKATTERMKESNLFPSIQPIKCPVGDATVDGILDRLAYEYMKANKFGGNTRKIHTQTDKRLKGKKAKVDSIKFVKTGIRVPASGGHDYYGEYDYEPAHLSEEKTCKILTLSLRYEQDNIGAFTEWIRIEVANVKKIMSREDYGTVYPQELGIFESFRMA